MFCAAQRLIYAEILHPRCVGISIALKLDRNLLDNT